MTTSRTFLCCALAVSAAVLAWGSACAGPDASRKAPRADAKPTAPTSAAPPSAPTAAAAPVAALPACPDNGRVRFAFNSVELDEAARATLSAFAKCLGGARPAALVIEGHCDERGTTEFNIALGARRADAIRDYLARLGVDRSVMKTVSYGEERPADARLSEDAWAENRRGELVTSR